MLAGYANVATTVTIIYRRSQRGYRCNYDCTETYRDDDDDEDEDEDDPKSCFKIAQNRICIS